MDTSSDAGDGKRFPRVRLVYFGGTGCTARVARTFQTDLESRGIAVQTQELRHDVPDLDGNFDLLILCFAVHACTAPDPVMRWVRRIEPGNGIPAAVFSVSAGGEVTPNLACRVAVNRLLRKKGFDVEYEKMIVMPSNWIVQTKAGLAARLLEVLPKKVAFALDEITAGIRLTSRVGPGNRLLALFGKTETAGAKLFGRYIRVAESCTGCAKCVRHCPVGNIAMAEGKPLFGGNCVLCLSCIYRCPAKALAPGYGKFILVKEGFDLDTIAATLPWTKPVDIEKDAPGFLWLGLRRYLLDETDSQK